VIRPAKSNVASTERIVGSQKNLCRTNRDRLTRHLLFSTSVRDNIAYGRPDATEEEIVDAARRAQPMSSFVKLPNGYQSAVASVVDS